MSKIFAVVTSAVILASNPQPPPKMGVSSRGSGSKLLHLSASQSTLGKTVTQGENVETFIANSFMTISSYRLQKPLEVHLRKDNDGAWLINSPALTSYGAGATPIEAVKDFESMLIEQFEDFLRNESMLSKRLKRDLDLLRTYIAKN